MSTGIEARLKGTELIALARQADTELGTLWGSLHPLRILSADILQQLTVHPLQPLLDDLTLQQAALLLEGAAARLTRPEGHGMRPVCPGHRRTCDCPGTVLIQTETVEHGSPLRTTLAVRHGSTNFAVLRRRATGRRTVELTDTPAAGPLARTALSLAAAGFRGDQQPAAEFAA